MCGTGGALTGSTLAWYNAQHSGEFQANAKHSVKTRCIRCKRMRRTFTRKTTSVRIIYSPTCSTSSSGAAIRSYDLKSLRDESVEEIAVVPLGEENGETVQRYRDVLKSCVIKRGDEASFVLLGIENQSHMHHAMPVRAMLYDGLRYDKQVKTVASSHRQSGGKGLTSAEFLSGFAKSDKLTPVITLVIYFGPERWDAPRSLHEMFDDTVCNKRLMRFAPDYPINLIEPAALSEEELAKFVTDFRQVMEFLKYSNDKQRISALLSEGSPYANISTSAALVLNTCTGMGLKINQSEEKTNMCKAIRMQASWK